MWISVTDNELYHHGIKGQRWGVRRFQNPDGTLTDAGKKRYNLDSDKYALSAGEKFRSLVNISEKKNAAQRAIARNPKGFEGSREKEEYLKAIDRCNRAFEEHNTLEKSMKTKYSEVEYDFQREAKTGEQYVRSKLTDKQGNIYISELYLGVRED